eukprot:m.191494 g.191494  ORF g.191494 m.191494 type:complete len:366 (-) comp14844_c0_seq3:1867-2964(-)
MSSFWDKVQRVSKKALECGALVPLTTKVSFVHVDGLKLPVYILERIKRKDAVSKRAKRDGTFNPFLSPEPELTVCSIGAHHTCVLNKFNVYDNHLLIISKEFVPQTSLLRPRDFAAAIWALEQRPFLCFFNGGEVAGASQRHMHLQLLSTPLVSGEKDAVPLSPLLNRSNLTPQCTIPQLGFTHRIHFFQEGGDEWQDANTCASIYTMFLRDLECLPPSPSLLNTDEDSDSVTASVAEYMDGSVDSVSEVRGDAQVVEQEPTEVDAGKGVQASRGHAGKGGCSLDIGGRERNLDVDPTPYNLLMTREWMMVVPRTQSHVNGVECNAMAFAGSILIREEAMLRPIQQHGWLYVLKTVTQPLQQQQP